MRIVLISVIIFPLIQTMHTYNYSLRNIHADVRGVNDILKPKEMNNVTSALRTFPFVYYGYISRLSLSGLNKYDVERRLEELYPFLLKKKCTALHCLMTFDPKPGSVMTVSALSWVLSFSTLSNSVMPNLLQYATGLPQALFFSLQLSKYQIIIPPVNVIKEGDVFAKLVSPQNGGDLPHEMLISPCNGVLQYVWPNISTPTVGFMLIARIQCNLKI